MYMGTRKECAWDSSQYNMVYNIKQTGGLNSVFERKGPERKKYVFNAFGPG